MIQLRRERGTRESEVVVGVFYIANIENPDIIK